MVLRRITEPREPLLGQLLELYRNAFPPDERRSEESLLSLIACQPSMYFNAVEEDEKIAGLFIYWQFEDFYYLEHLAVCPELRNQKIGQKVLDYVRKNFERECILEVEAPTDELKARRVRYYERNGFRVVDRHYVQPAYEKNLHDQPLWLMSNGKEEEEKKLGPKVARLKEEVYLKNRR